MPCPHGGEKDVNMLADETERGASSGGLNRRDLMKSAVSIGGASALSTAMGIAGLSGTAAAGRITAAERENRQHAWADFLTPDARGIPAPPAHHVLLFMNYDGSRGVSAADRLRMEASFRQLERAFEWSDQGLVFTVNYSPDYFDRYFDEPLSGGVDLRTPEHTIEQTRSRVDPDDITPDHYDFFVDLASDNGTNVIAAEQALFGEVDDINGTSIDYDLRRVVESRPTSFPDRRTGFVGGGEPKEHIGERNLRGEHDLGLSSFTSRDQGDGAGRDVAENIPEDAPLSMGFQSVHADNVPDEDLVTMVHDHTLGGSFENPGQFAQGTIQHASKLRIDLSSWYANNSLEERTAKMFSPHHDAPADEVNNNVRSDAPADARIRDVGADDDLARRTEDDAKAGEILGHGQKLARARFDLTRRDTDDQQNDELDTTVLRRDFNTTDATDADEESALHFLALMRFNGYMNYVRQSMNGVNFDNSAAIANSNLDDIQHTDLANDEVAVDNDGFLNFVTAHRRANFVVPPITLRSLPTPQAISGSISLDSSSISNGDQLTVVLEGVRAGSVRKSTLRFGPIETVNKARGEAPNGRVKVRDVDDDGDYELKIPVEASGFDAGQQIAKLRAKTDRGVEVQATTTVSVS